MSLADLVHTNDDPQGADWHTGPILNSPVDKLSRLIFERRLLNLNLALVTI
jgi:hypothetical protein